MRTILLPMCSEVKCGRNSILLLEEIDFRRGEEVALTSIDLNVSCTATVVTSFSLPFDCVQNIFLYDSIVPQMKTWWGAYQYFKGIVGPEFNKNTEVMFLLLERN
jgi:hypothetical protein